MDVHHNLPRVNRQIGVVEGPVELLLRLRLVRRVVVRGQVRVRERLAGLDAFPRVEDEHAFEQFDC